MLEMHDGIVVSSHIVNPISQRRNPLEEES
jgi:hypothetical protein